MFINTANIFSKLSLNVRQAFLRLINTNIFGKGRNSRICSFIVIKGLITGIAQYIMKYVSEYGDKLLYRN